MNPILIDVPMPIKTPRLLIRPRQVGEGPVIAKAVTESLEHLKPWMPFAQEAPTNEKMEIHCRMSAADFTARKNFTLSIYDRDGKTLIGSTGLHEPSWDVRSFHIGYWVHKNFEGHGYIQESTHALTLYAFKVFQARRVEIRCDTRNMKSLSVMKKLGFQHEGTLMNDSIGVDGTIRSTIVMARYDLNGLPCLDVSW